MIFAFTCIYACVYLIMVLFGVTCWPRIIQFSFFHFLNHKNNNLIISHIYSPQKGTLTVTPGMGGRDHLGPQITNNLNKSQQITKANSAKVGYTSGACFNKCWQISLNYLHIYRKSHRIWLTLEKKNYNTKHTKNTNIYFPKSNIFEQITKHNFRDIQKKHHNSILLYIYIFHNSYFVYFVYFICFVYLLIDRRKGTI